MAKAAKTETELQMQEQVAHLREEIAEITATLGEISSMTIAQAKNKTNEIIGTAKETGQQKLNEAKNTLSSIESEMCDYVHEKPVTSLAIAAGVGFLTALILRR